MINKLRQNYKLTMTLAIAVFLIAFVFCHYFDVTSGFSFLTLLGVYVPKNFFIVCAVALAFAALCVGLLRLVVFLYMRLFKIYVLPSEEAFLLLLLFVSGRNVILGLFNLLFHYLPATYVWGGAAAYTVLSVVMCALFFMSINKLYLGAKIAPKLFKEYAIVCLVFIALGALKLYGGVL